MGSADVALQHKLIDTYLRLLLEGGDLFLHRGSEACGRRVPLLERLKEVEARGVRLVVCSTCLGYFGLTERVRVGIVGGMADIQEAQARAGKVITL
jgi:hypothetical protein